MAANLSIVCGEDWFRQSLTFRTECRTGTTESIMNKQDSDVNYQELWVIWGEVMELSSRQLKVPELMRAIHAVSTLQCWGC